MALVVSGHGFVVQRLLAFPYRAIPHVAAGLPLHGHGAACAARVLALHRDRGYVGHLNQDGEAADGAGDGDRREAWGFLQVRIRPVIPTGIPFLQRTGAFGAKCIMGKGVKVCKVANL